MEQALQLRRPAMSQTLPTAQKIVRLLVELSDSLFHLWRLFHINLSI